MPTAGTLLPPVRRAQSVATAGGKKVEGQGGVKGPAAAARPGGQDTIEQQGERMADREIAREVLK